MGIFIKVIVYLIGYIISVFGGSVIIKWFLRSVKIDTGKFDNTGLPKAGKYIGYLERFIITTFVLLGQYTAISFVLTAKSIFRFSDIKNKEDRELAEYIIIGTLASFSIALFIGLSMKCIIKNLWGG